MLLALMAGISKVFHLPFHGNCVKLLKLLPSLTPLDVQTTLPRCPLQVETLSLRKPTSLQKLRRKVAVLWFSKGNGYGKCLPSLRSNASCGNATIRASQCVLLQLLEEWTCPPCAQYVMKPSNPLSMPLEIAGLFGPSRTPFCPHFSPTSSLRPTCLIGLG